MICVGIPISKLRAHAPRGVVRAARAITERLTLCEDLQLLAIADPVLTANQVLLECWPMDEWLESRPLLIAKHDIMAGPAAIPAVYRPWVHHFVRLLAFLRLRSLVMSLARSTRPWRVTFKRTLRTGADAMGLGQPARRAWRWMLGLVYQASTALSPPAAALSPGWAAAEEPIGQFNLWPADSDEPIGARGFVRLQDLDVIISFECYDAIWDWPVEAHECKLIGVFHDAIPFRIHEGRNYDPGGYYRALGKMVNRASVIACDSIATQEDLHAFFPNAASKTRVVYLGHDRERFRLDESIDLPVVGASPIGFADVAENEKSVGIIENRSRHAMRARRQGKRIAMIGDVEPRKNQAAVLRACGYLADALPNDRISLLLIGQLPEPNPYVELERQARRYVDIQWLGYTPDDEIRHVLRSCDVFVYASLWEGFGIPLLEAMSAGVPVVCSNSSSLPEVAGDCAFYCDPYDPASVASAIAKALALSGRQRSEWVERAAQRAGRFHWTETAGQYHQLIQQIAGQGAHQGSSGTAHDWLRLSADVRVFLHTIEDPGQRDYIVSSAKIEATGFKPAHSLDAGIRELIKGYSIVRNGRYGNVG